MREWLNQSITNGVLDYLSTEISTPLGGAKVLLCASRHDGVRVGCFARSRMQWTRQRQPTQTFHNPLQ